MRREALEVLRCPACREALEAEARLERDDEIETGSLRCRGCANTYAIERFVPRFVPQDNYAGSFGMQWNLFRRTQLDSHTSLPISRDRLLCETKWTLDELKDKRVLDVGCGAGRFSEVLLGAGAKLFSLDYSSAVDAAMANLGPHPNLTIVQGDVFQLPFQNEAFDYVMSLGVMQHTPDPRRALLSLIPPLKKGGKLAVDFYPRLALNVLWPKYWLRPLTKRMNPKRLFAIVQRVTPLLLPVSTVLASIPVIGKRLRYLVPVMNYRGVFPLTREQHREWAVLDTFDMFAPAHDHPQDVPTVKTWLADAGLASTDVVREGLVIVRGRK